ncbi:MAG: hypothetical protein AABX03_05190 [Nanoarchaeota archaeon]
MSLRASYFNESADLYNNIDCILFSHSWGVFTVMDKNSKRESVSFVNKLGRIVLIEEPLDFKPGRAYVKYSNMVKH